MLLTRALALCSRAFAAGRYHLLNAATNKPIGTYTAVVQGLGRFSMQYDAALGTVTLPTARTRQLPSGTFVTFVDVPVTRNDYDIMLLISWQNATAPITSFKLYPPGCCDSVAGTCSSTCTATYNPTYLKTLSGFKGVRTMDWQRTNGANLVNWEDRGRTTAISQARVISRVVYIQAINCWSSGTPPAFFQGAPLVVVTTAAPHNLTTGQLVTLKGTAGGYLASGATTLTSFDLSDTMVRRSKCLDR
jgi:hypothetical protein